MSKLERSPKKKEILAVIDKLAGIVRPKDIWLKTKEIDPNVSWQGIAQYTKRIGRQYARQREGRTRGRKSIVWFTKEILGLRLHPGQIRFLGLAQATLEHSTKWQKLILCPSYQYGKTVMLAVIHIWMNYYKVGLPKIARETNLEYQTLSISPKLTQCQILYKYIQMILQSKFWWFEKEKTVFKTNRCRIRSFLYKPVNIPSPQSLSNTPIEFSNGSRIRIASTSGDQAANLAGDQFAFISYDECLLSLHLEDELPTRIESRLIKFGGAIILVGTPDPIAESNQYYMHICQLGLEGKAGFKTFVGKLDDNYFIPEKNRERIKKAIRETNPELYNAAVFGEFTTSISRIFTPHEIERLWNESLHFEKPQGSHEYYVGVDWAMEGGWTVIFVLDVTSKPYKIVHFDRFRGGDLRPEEQYAKVIDLKRKYNDANGVHDSSSMGGKIIDKDIEDLGFYALDFSGPDRKGNIIYALKKYLAAGDLRSPYISQLARELGSYKRKDDRLTKDCICALASICYVLDEESHLGVGALDISL